MAKIKCISVIDVPAGQKPSIHAFLLNKQGIDQAGKLFMKLANQKGNYLTEKEIYNGLMRGHLEDKESPPEWSLSIVKGER